MTRGKSIVGSAHAQPEVAGMADAAQRVGRVQQGLGGNAAPVEADAAQVLAFHQRGAQLELRRAQRGHVATRAAADDEDVEVRVSHYPAA